MIIAFKWQNNIPGYFDKRFLPMAESLQVNILNYIILVAEKYETVDTSIAEHTYRMQWLAPRPKKKCFMNREYGITCVTLVLQLSEVFCSYSFVLVCSRYGVPGLF